MFVVCTGKYKGSVKCGMLFENAEITFKNVRYLITPSSALGSEAVFAAIKNNIEILAIEENSTVLKVDAQALNLENKVKICKNYQEAFDFITIS